MMGFDKVDQGELQRFRHMYNTVAFRTTLGVICAIMLLLSTTCFALICIFHSHLLFQCSYSEFVFIAVMQLIVTGFCVYHFHGIYEFVRRRRKWERREQRRKRRAFAVDETQSLIAGRDAAVANDKENHLNHLQQNKDNDNNIVGDDEQHGQNVHVDGGGGGGAAAAGDNSESESESESESDSEDESEFDEFGQKKKKSFMHYFKHTAWTLIKLCTVGISFTALAVFVMFTIVSISYQQSTLPKVNGELNLEGCCTGKTSIHRESSGMIHIEAENDMDLFFAQGVATAQERMWQLEFNKRVASGSLSQIVGSGGLSVDKWSRTIGFHRAAVKDMESNAFETKDMQILEAYCAGINAYLKSNPPLSPEFSILGVKPTPYEPADIVAWGKIVAWGLSFNANHEAMRFSLLAKGISVDRVNTLFPTYPVNDPTAPTVLSKEDLHINTTMEEDIALENRFTNDSGAYIPLEANTDSINDDDNNNIDDDHHHLASVGANMASFIDQYMQLTKTLQASNNWVVSGRFTKDKNSILCDDPHLGFTAPNIWMLIHLKSNSGSGIDAMGAVFPGTPGVIIGKNSHIAWGVTNAGADVQDLFVMQDAEDEKGKYVHNGQKLSYEVIKEVIHVKDGQDVELDVTMTRYGPVINNVMGLSNAKEKLALWWTGIQPQDTTVSSFFNIFRATDWQSFVEALKPYVVPAQNFVFADSEARIGYFMPGKVPVRREGHSGRFPVAGDGSNDFMDRPDGFIPFDDLPHVFEPQSGYIVSANNRIVPLGYAYSISQDYENKYRAWRIKEMITSRIATSDVDVDFMKQVQMDVYSKLFEEYKFALEKIQHTDMMPSSMQQWLDMLLEWDGVQGENIQEPAVFEQWFSELTKLTVPEIGFALHPRQSDYLKHAILKEDPSCMRYNNMTCTAFVAYSLEQAVLHLQEEYGNNIPLWGTEIHESLMPHGVLDSTPFGCLASKSVYNVGGTFTVNVANTLHPTLQVDEGVSYRQIVTMGPHAAEEDEGEGQRKADQFIMPLGQSGNWLSKNYANWLFMWRDGLYLPMQTKGYDIASTLTLAQSE